MIKILVFGYYDDFAHFFNELRRYHQSMSDVKYIYVTNNMSGYLSWPTRDRYLLRPISVLASKNQNGEFEYALGMLQQQLSKLRINHSAVSYLPKIRQINTILNVEKPDLVIISGDSKPSAFIFKTLCSGKKIPMRFFEQGPSGTTVFSKTGVLLNQCDTIDVHTLADIVEKPINRLESRKYRYFDLLQIGSPDVEKSQLRDKISLGKFNNLLSRSEELKKHEGKCLLLALQDPDDVNFLSYSGFGCNESLIHFTLEALPSGWSCIIREHPKCRGQYSKEVYRLIERNDSAILDSTKKPVAYWENIDAFVCVNSLMAFEAVDRSVPVFILGQSVYSNLFETPRTVEELNDGLKKNIASSSVSKEKTDEFIRRYFYKGHFRKPTMQLLDGLIHSMEQY